MENKNNKNISQNEEEINLEIVSIQFIIRKEFKFKKI